MQHRWNTLAAIAAAAALAGCDNTPTQVKTPRLSPHGATRDEVAPGFAIDLGTLGGTVTTARSINSHGTAVGDGNDFEGYPRAWVSQNGATMTVGPQLWPNGLYGSVFAINDAGEIVGERQQPSGGGIVAYLAEPGGATVDLPTPAVAGAPNSRAYAIDAAGDAAGYYLAAAGGIYHAAYWPKGGNLVDLETLGGINSWALGMNDHGEVVGYRNMPDNSDRAFYWSAETNMIDVGEAILNDINNQGIAVGAELTSDGGGMTWTRAHGPQLIPLSMGVTSAYPVSVNEVGVWAGWCMEGPVMRACAGRVDGPIFYVSEEGEQQSEIVSINDANVALGYLKMPDGKSHVVEWHLSPPDANHAPVLSIGGPYDGHAGSALTLSWSATDADNDPLTYTWDFGDGNKGSGTTLPASHVYSTKGSYVLSVSVADGRGGTNTGTQTVTVGDPLDVTPPVITPTITGTAGLDGWYTSNVGLTWNETDPESGVTSTSGCDAANVTSNTPGASFTCSATNGAGLTAQGKATIKRDASTPTVTQTVNGTLGRNGWYTSDVSVSWSVTADGPSGATPSASCATRSITTDNAGTTIACTGTTGAGLSHMASVTVKRDATPPTITYGGNAGTYTVDQTIAITCAANDAMSGLASSTCANVTGDAYTFPLGTSSYGATATDNAGSVTNASTSFVVQVTTASLSALTQRWVSNAGVANSLTSKLAAAASGNPGALQAYIHEVEAQSGKKIPADEAAILIRLATALQ